MESNTFTGTDPESTSEGAEADVDRCLFEPCRILEIWRLSTEKDSGRVEAL